ncbi:hypothetical protein L7F22_050200 [Adiantum nelumboides]|nr:hypothetical protein [Adiantum nelumboides]
MPANGKRKNGSQKRQNYDEPDEEELRLTESLFGGNIKGKKKKTRQNINHEDEEREQNSSKIPQSTAEQLMEDDDLFVLDTAAEGVEDNGSQSSSSASSSSASDSDDSEEDSESDSESEEKGDTTNTHNPDKPLLFKKKEIIRREPVWTDPSSATLTVTLAGADAKAEDGSRKGMNKLRNLRETADEVSISGTEYELRLRRTFEKLHPRPRWASLELRKADGSSAGMQSLGDLLNTDMGLVSRSRGDRRQKGTTLPKQRIEIQRLRNANEGEARTKPSAIEQVAFHPATRANVMLTTSKDRMLHLYHIDTKENPLLESVHFPDMPLRSAQFHPSGSSIMLSGPRPFFYVHDIYSGKTTRSTPWRAYASAGEEDSQERDLSLARFAPAQDGGKQLAIGGRRGAIYLLDYNQSGGSGGGNLIGRMQMNAPLKGLSWDPANENRLASLSNQGVVHVWDTDR